MTTIVYLWLFHMKPQSHSNLYIEWIKCETATIQLASFIYFEKFYDDDDGNGSGNSNEFKIYFQFTSWRSVKTHIHTYKYYICLFCTHFARYFCFLFFLYFVLHQKIKVISTDSRHFVRACVKRLGHGNIFVDNLIFVLFFILFFILFWCFLFTCMT